MDLLLEVTLSDLALGIASGELKMSQKDIVMIASQLDFGGMKPRYLPKKKLASAKLKIQKQACLDLVKKLWGLGEEQLIELERGWLLEVRSQTGVQKETGKENPMDLVTPQILARVVSVAYLYFLAERDQMPTDDLGTDILLRGSLRSLNIFLEGATFKGTMRSIRVAKKEGKPKIASVALINLGIPVGTTGLFLPNPSVSLPYIFFLFRREKIRPIVYK